MPQFPTITQLSLANFRAFKKAPQITLRPLTFLVGPNSGGKSSILSAIGLLGQSMIHPGDPLNSEVTWSGSLVDLGSFTDAVHRHKTNLMMKIAVETANFRVGIGRRRTARYAKTPVTVTVCISNGGTDNPGLISKIVVSDKVSGQSVTLRPVRRRSNPYVEMQLLGRTESVPVAPEGHIRSGAPVAQRIGEVVRAKQSQLEGMVAGWQRIIEYVDGYSFFHILPETERVSSGRAGPKRWYAAGSARDRMLRFFGEPTKFEDVDPIMIAAARNIEGASKKGRKRKAAISLDTTLKQLNIASSIRPEKLSPYHTGISIRDNMTGVQSNLIDVGYGASQIIPVLRACQSLTNAPLCIEQPEIHLHPKAQGNVAEVLCDTSLRRQVLVETHSVHMINRARLRIARGELKSSDVIVLYVDRNRQGSHIKEIAIADNGEFTVEWPEGFFEERYSDTLELMQIQKEKV